MNLTPEAKRLLQSASCKLAEAFGAADDPVLVEPSETAADRRTEAWERLRTDMAAHESETIRPANLVRAHVRKGDL